MKKIIIILSLFCFSFTFAIIDQPIVEDFSMDVMTDREIYSPEDAIEITIKAEGSGMLQFNTGCQATYRIGDFNLEEGRACTLAITYASLPNSWKFTHDLERHPLEPGVYKLEAGLLDHKRDTVKIEIREDYKTDEDEKEVEEDDYYKDIIRRLEEIMERIRRILEN